MELWERTTWLNKDIDYLFGNRITEYDMKSAGLSLSKKFKLLPESTIRDLESVSKQDRNIRMGLIQRKDKEYTKKLLDAFKQMRKEFFEANDLNESNLLSIKKDAFFVIDKKCHTTDFGEVKFDSKNKYTSYMYLNKLEFYFNTATKHVDIKGLGQGKTLDEIREAHKDFMLDFMLRYVRMKEIGVSGNPMDIFLRKFVEDYRNKQLPVGYYRELSKFNAYLVYDEVLGEYQYIKDVGTLDDVVIARNYYEYIVKLVSLCI
jgi:hypothetical protein